MENGESVIYRGCTPVFDTEYSVDSDRSAAEVIVNAVATAAGVDPTDLPPLYEFVDPDAVDTLFDHEGTGDASTLLCFQFDGWNVFARADGDIRICDSTKPTAPQPVFEGPTV